MNVFTMHVVQANYVYMYIIIILVLLQYEINALANMYTYNTN